MSMRTWTALTGAVLVLAATGCAGGAAEPDTGASEPTPSPSSSAHHGHGLREATGDDPPSVALEAAEDPSSGWNVRLKVERYAFTPESVGGQPRQGEGHAHLYVDGEKIARVYGPWHHVPASAVGAGEHTLSVRLSANDHSTWAVDGEPISDSTTITGREGGASPTAKADTTVEITLKDGTVTPESGRVEVDAGDRVRITVRSDTADTVHLHGYDIEQPVSPGEPAVLTFTAETSGLFELETHGSGTLLTQVAVR